MKTPDDILKAALITQDPGKLFLLVEDAIRVARYEAGKREIAEAKLVKLRSQNQRQLEMINNYEKTLFKKP